MSKSQHRSCVECQTASCRLITPIGKIRLVACRSGIHSVDWFKTDAKDDDNDDDHRYQHSDPSKPSTKLEFGLLDAEDDDKEKANDDLSIVRPGVNWLESYFLKKRPTSLEICWKSVGQEASFTLRVLNLLFERVEFGQTVTYKELAVLAGSPNASRAVGQAMRKNPIPLIIPCHRVLPSGGKLPGNYTGGKWIKVWLLEHEKVSGSPEGKGKPEA